MSGVFQNIDPPAPSPLGECVPPPHFWCGGGHLLCGEGGGGVNVVWKTPDTALYSIICKFFVVRTIQYTLME